MSKWKTISENPPPRGVSLQFCLGRSLSSLVDCGTITKDGYIHIARDSSACIVYSLRSFHYWRPLSKGPKNV